MRKGHRNTKLLIGNFSVGMGNSRKIMRFYGTYYFLNINVRKRTQTDKKISVYFILY